MSTCKRCQERAKEVHIHGQKCSFVDGIFVPGGTACATITALRNKYKVYITNYGKQDGMIIPINNKLRLIIGWDRDTGLVTLGTVLDYVDEGEVFTEKLAEELLARR